MCRPSKAIAREPLTRFLLCYITDRNQFPGTGEAKERLLLGKIAECAAAGVDYVQLREKDLSTLALEALAEKAIVAIPSGAPTKLLINSRTDVALATGAHGVHLPAADISASEARSIIARAGRAGSVIGVSTHTVEEVALAESHGADFAIFGPVFEKNGHANAAGLEQLHRACNRPDQAAPPIPVLALGGITRENASQCFLAGASGIAGIRLFQKNAVEPLVRSLRAALVP